MTSLKPTLELDRVKVYRLSYFNIFFNDLDSPLALGGFQGITEGVFNLISLMYADDVHLLSNSREDLQAGLDCFYDFCLK